MAKQSRLIKYDMVPADCVTGDNEMQWAWATLPAAGWPEGAYESVCLGGLLTYI